MLPLIVAALGALIGIAGLIGVATPAGLLRLMSRFVTQPRLYVIAAARLAIGVVLLLAAPQCRLTILVQITGVVAIVSGIATALIGEARVRRTLGWFTALPPAVIRLFCAGAIVFGAALVYAGT